MVLHWTGTHDFSQDESQDSPYLFVAKSPETIWEQFSTKDFPIIVLHFLSEILITERLKELFYTIC